MRKNSLIFSALFVFLTVLSFAQPGPDLENPQAGKCYAKCLIPAKIETVTVPVTIREASSRVSISPATFRGSPRRAVH